MGIAREEYLYRNEMNMFSKIGIMQGRLLPKYHGRYQAHPVGYWEEEFKVAKSLSLGYIEFIFDYNNYKKNPLWTTEGLSQIRKTTLASGVAVYSVCADYFMEAPLHIQEFADTSREVLIRLVEQCGELGITDLVIPCVDQSRLKGSKEEDAIVEVLNDVASVATANRVNLSLETDLNATRFAKLLDRLNHACVTVNYDSGNSAAWGYDIREEFAAYGDRISDLHLKDRALGGGPVSLGDGNCDFEQLIRMIDKMDYKGLLVYQAFRDDEGVDVFKKQASWLAEKWTDLLSR